MLSRFLEGLTINSINAIGGHIAGRDKIYELRVTGGTIDIINKKDVEKIDNAINEARTMIKNNVDIDICNYLHYCICVEKILD